MRALIFSLIGLSFFLTPASYAQKTTSPCAMGHTALQSGDTATAIDFLETCLDSEEIDPDVEAVIHSSLGAAYIFEDRFPEALNALNMAFAIAETRQVEISNPIVWRNRGIARAQTGSPEAALEDLMVAISIDPNDVLSHLNLGGVYQELERPADVVVAFDRVVRLEPEWTGGWLNRSGALLDMGMTEAAVDDARRAVELDPTNGSSLNMLCWTLIQDGRAATALPLCEQAVAAEPDIGAIVHSHASALEAVGRLDEARALFARAHDLSPDDPEISADFERTHTP